MPNSAISSIQASYITAAFRDAAMYPPGSTPGGVPPKGRPGPVPATEFFFRVGFVLTTQRNQGEVLDFLTREAPDYPVDDVSVERVELADPGIPGLGRIQLIFRTPDGVNRDWARADRGVPDPYLLPKAQITVSVVEAIDRQFGRRVATFEHLLNAAQTVPTIVTWCPATEPEVPADTAPVPGVSTSPCTGQGASVVVVDGGLVPDAPATHSWMHGVTGDPDPDSPVGGPIELYGGHGTFIASIIRAMAPQASVHVARVLANAAAAYETDVVLALQGVLASDPDVISLSCGTHTWLNGGLLSFQAFIDGPLAQHPGTVLVAAAGNDGANWPFAPAEMDPVIGVGALGLPGDRLAWFSNWGPWVKVYAPGEELVHAFGSGTYTYQEPPRRPPVPATATFDGMATWSGTSFSTPIVAGLIAARKSGTGGTARAAADALLALARAQALPDVGPVLRPGQACLP